MRSRHGLRWWLGAAVVAAVAAGSLFDAEAADFVAGGDGDVFVVRANTGLALSAPSASHVPDVCAAQPRAVRFVAVVGFPWPLCPPVASWLHAGTRTDPSDLAASRPRSSRAPPAD